MDKIIQAAQQECKEMKSISAHAMSVFIRVCPVRNLGVTCEECRKWDTEKVKGGD